jgi:hypothetical protein
VPRPASGFRVQALDRGAGDAGPALPRVGPLEVSPPSIPSDRPVRASEPLPQPPVARTGQVPPCDRGAGPRSSNGQPREVDRDRGTGSSVAEPLRAAPQQGPPAGMPPIRPVHVPEIPPSPPVARTVQPIPLAVPERKMPADLVPVRPARAPEPLPQPAVARTSQATPVEQGAGSRFPLSGTQEVACTRPDTIRWHGKGEKFAFGPLIPSSISGEAVRGTTKRPASTSSSRSGGRPRSRRGAWATTRSMR